MSKTKPLSKEEISRLEALIGYEFKEKARLDRALTHASARSAAAAPRSAPGTPETVAPRGRRAGGDDEDDRGARRGSSLPARGKVAAPVPARARTGNTHSGRR